MNKAGKDKFCQNCQKKVYDFTNRTEDELNFLYSIHSGNMCGRFYEDQLNPNLLHLENYKNGNLFSWRKTLASLITIVGLNTISPAQTNYIVSKTELRHPVKSSNNSFVSGYLIEYTTWDSSSTLLSYDTIGIKIYLEEKLAAKLRAHNGRFFYDFGRVLAPDTKIKIVAEPYSYPSKKSARYRKKFKGATIETIIAEAGAITIKVEQTRRRKFKSYFIKKRVMMGRFR